MRIGELARIAGCQTVTIRYYEKAGLLPNRKRTDGNYRIYDEADMERLRFIKHCRNHGISLKDIKNMLAFRDGESHDSAAVLDILVRNIEALRMQMSSISELLDSLEGMLKCAPHGSNAASHALDLLGAPCPHCSDYAEKTK